MNIDKIFDIRFAMIFLLAFVMVLSLIFAGCGDDDDDDDSSGGGGLDGDDDDDSGMIGDDDDDDQPGNAMVRAIHLSPDAPAVDIFVNNEILAFEELEFGSGTDYAELPAGTYDFDLTAHKGSVEDAVLSIAGLMLAESTSYTAVAFGNLSSIGALALVDDYSALDEGNIRVRAIHTAPDVPQVDIWVIPAEGDPSILYENVDFGVAGDYYDLPAASYTIGFDVDDDASPDVIFTIPELPAGTVANVFAVNQGESVFLVAQLNDGTTVTINPES